MRFKKLKNAAQQLLSQYETKDPATYAAAEQAIGGLLVLDGFVGIDDPFGGKKRPGIFGSLIGIAAGIVFLFVPVIFNAVSGINKMTATTTATVVSVIQQQNSSNNSNDSNSCTAIAQYTVDGKKYQQTSSFGSSSFCGLTQGSSIPISYNPDQPGQWGYKVQTISNVIKIFPAVGVLAVVTSLVTFVIRLASIIFGWKILKSGRARAKTLPQGSDLGAIIEQIRQEFKGNLFRPGGVSQGALASVPAPVPPAQPAAPVAPGISPITSPTPPAQNIVTPTPAPVQPPVNPNDNNQPQ